MLENNLLNRELTNVDRPVINEYMEFTTTTVTLAVVILFLYYDGIKKKKVMERKMEEMDKKMNALTKFLKKNGNGVVKAKIIKKPQLNAAASVKKKAENVLKDNSLQQEELLYVDDSIPERADYMFYFYESFYVKIKTADILRCNNNLYDSVNVSSLINGKEDLYDELLSQIEKTVKDQEILKKEAEEDIGNDLMEIKKIHMNSDIVPTINVIGENYYDDSANELERLKKHLLHEKERISKERSLEVENENIIENNKKILDARLNNEYFNTVIDVGTQKTDKEKLEDKNLSAAMEKRKKQALMKLRKEEEKARKKEEKKQKREAAKQEKLEKRNAKKEKITKNGTNSDTNKVIKENIYKRDSENKQKVG